MSIDYPLGPVIVLARSFGYVYNTSSKFPPVEHVPNSIKRTAVCPHKQPCHCHTCGHTLHDMQGPELGKSIDVLSLLAASIVPPSTKKARQQGGSLPDSVKIDFSMSGNLSGAT